MTGDNPMMALVGLWYGVSEHQHGRTTYYSWFQEDLESCELDGGFGDSVASFGELTPGCFVDLDGPLVVRKL
jgi:hypothetical protein